VGSGPYSPDAPRPLLTGPFFPLLMVTFLIFGAREAIFYLNPYMYFYPHISFLFFRFGQVGVRSLHIMMMSIDEFRDDRLREDRNFLVSSNEIAFAPAS
jgi:hypothetical protein